MQGFILDTVTGDILTMNDLRERVSGGDKTVDVSLPQDLRSADLSEFGVTFLPWDRPEGKEGYFPAGVKEDGDGWVILWDKPVPYSVTMRQAQLALEDAGFLDDVEAAIELAGRTAQIEWRAAKDVYRDSPLALSMSDSLGLTDEQMDDLFVEASKK